MFKISERFFDDISSCYVIPHIIITYRMFCFDRSVNINGLIFNISLSLGWLLTITQAIHWKVSADGRSETTILWTTMKTIMIMPLYLPGKNFISFAGK